jgi:hypothetical protein
MSLLTRSLGTYAIPRFANCSVGHSPAYLSPTTARNLVWRAATRVMNPTVPQDFIDAEFERDPASANAEYNAEFRSDIAEFVALEVLEACTPDGLFEIPPASNVGYTAFCDPSAISHRDPDGVLVLDCVRETMAPFQPEAVVADFCETLAAYNISTSHRTPRRAYGELPAITMASEPKVAIDARTAFSTWESGFALSSSRQKLSSSSTATHTLRPRTVR